MLNLWLDPDDVIQDDDHDGGALPRPKRTVSDHFRPAGAESGAKKTAEGNCTYMTCAKLSIFLFHPHLPMSLQRSAVTVTPSGNS